MSMFNSLIRHETRDGPSTGSGTLSRVTKSHVPRQMILKFNFEQLLNNRPPSDESDRFEFYRMRVGLFCTCREGERPVARCG